jgi:hypothetical protein
MERARGVAMKTADGYTIKTADGYPISVKSNDVYNYPLICTTTHQKIYTALISAQKIYTVVVDQ